MSCIGLLFLVRRREMAQKWVAAFLTFMLAAIAACGSSAPPEPTRTTTLFPVTPSTSKAKPNIDGEDIAETNCDIPAKNVVRATNSYGEYTALLEVQRSDLKSCERFYWLRLTLTSWPASETGKGFAAVLRAGNEGDVRLKDVATQPAQSSDPRVTLITKGRVLREGVQVQGCLVLLDKSGQPQSGHFTCTTPQVVSSS